jgi:predicted RNase H-like HicB family nuclease
MDRVVYQIEETRAGAGWSAHCPELEVTAFGDTRDDAKTSLRRQVIEYLEDCEELGVLEDVLVEAGFYDDGDGWMSSLVEPPQPSIRFIGSPFGSPEDAR